MDVNWLIRQLKHGQAHTVQKQDGTVYQEVSPPSKLTLDAARVIERFATQLEHYKIVEENLMRQINNLYDEINKLQCDQTSNAVTQQDANQLSQ